MKTKGCLPPLVLMGIGRSLITTVGLAMY